MELRDYFPIWDKLTVQHRQKLEASAMVRTFPRGTLIHGGGRECTGLLLVRSGQLRTYTISDEGREVTMYRLFHRDICLFSASCIMNSIQFDLYIDAEKDTEVFLIPPDVYKSVMEESASLANFTSEVMASRFSEVMWLIDQIMWKSFDKRLAGFLLEEAEIEGSDRLKLTHETIANHMGTAREVVTRMLRYFQNEGLVKLSRGTIELLNREGLAGL